MCHDGIGARSECEVALEVCVVFKIIGLQGNGTIGITQFDMQRLGIITRWNGTGMSGNESVNLEFQIAQLFLNFYIVIAARHYDECCTKNR